MTKEEQTIANLKKLKFFHNGSYGADIDRAIKAIEQQPCEDVISKASVFEIVGNLMSIPYDFDRQITEKDVSESMDEIRNLPTVTPTRKKGKWKRMSDLTIEQDDRWKCSRCGNVIHCKSKMNLRTFFGWDARCGAKMNEEE